MKASTLRSWRTWHRYLGLFFAPLILLFAVSGGLQTFRLQEAKGYGGPPPGWIVWLAAIHKDQAAPREAAPGAQASQQASVAPSKSPVGKSRRSFPLQLFVVAMAIALALSTLLGIAVALATRATRLTAIVTLAAGAILPILVFKL